MVDATANIKPKARTIIDRSIDEQRNQLSEAERIIVESITEARKSVAKQQRFKNLIQKQGHALRDVDNDNLTVPLMGVSGFPDIGLACGVQEDLRQFHRHPLSEERAIQTVNRWNTALLHAEAISGLIAWHIGALLNRIQQDVVPRGKWEEWLRLNLIGEHWSRTRVGRFQRIAREFTLEEVQGRTLQSIYRVLGIIQDGPTAPDELIMLLAHWQDEIDVFQYRKIEQFLAKRERLSASVMLGEADEETIARLEIEDAAFQARLRELCDVAGAVLPSLDELNPEVFKPRKQPEKQLVDQPVDETAHDSDPQW